MASFLLLKDESLTDFLLSEVKLGIIVLPEVLAAILPERWNDGPTSGNG